ncbi:MAG: hypothetical protein DWQ01_01335 [Planctomycetota bacterium]|nr:MAG: hypothetical protein DWQ01_01335 [Planctomycetota bacterium]
MKTTFFLSLLFLTVVAPSAIAQNYGISDLDHNQILTTSYPVALPDRGFAVGGGQRPIDTWTQPVWWDDLGSHLLPVLSGHEGGVATDGNSQGFMVGQSEDVQTGHIIIIQTHPVVWDQGQATALSDWVTGGDPLELKTATAVNEAGQILGSGWDPQLLRNRPYLFEGGIVHALPALAGGTGNAIGVALAENGEVVGWSEVSGGFRHAVHWLANGQLTDLHDPGVLLGRTSRAQDVNECGQICGSGDFIGDLIDWETAVVWDRGVIKSLGTLGGQESWAFGINDFGHVVGGGTNAVHQNVAFLWTGQGPMQDLNDLIPPGSGWWLLDAQDIDNQGRIVGVGSFLNAFRAYLLEPDGSGGYQVYGYGCAGSGGFTPELWGNGFPAPGQAAELQLILGLGGSRGRLLAGRGTGVLSIAPGCDLQILPLASPFVDFDLQGQGAGMGWQSLTVDLPAGLPSGSYYLQALLRDSGAAGGLTVSRPLEMSLP